MPIRSEQCAGPIENGINITASTQLQGTTSELVTYPHKLITAFFQVHLKQKLSDALKHRLDEENPRTHGIDTKSSCSKTDFLLH